MIDLSRSVSTVVMAGSLVLATTSLALAGADDSKTKAFFLPGVGSMNGPEQTARPSSDDTARNNRERSVATYRGTVPDGTEQRTVRTRKAHRAARHAADTDTE